MFRYFYHGTIRKAVVTFANLFNDMYIARYDENNVEVERIKVPIAYGPRQKFIRRLERIGTDFDQAKVKLENYLPRLAFEMQNITFDATRKLSTMNQTVIYNSATSSLMRYERVPYNIEMTLSILAKNTEDALQIFEQIVPYFQPEYTVTVDINETDKNVSIPVVFKNAVLSEGDDGSYGNYDTRKITVMVLSFTMKLYLYGPISTQKIISGMDINMSSSGGMSGFGPSGANTRIGVNFPSGGSTACGGTGNSTIVKTTY